MSPSNNKWLYYVIAGIVLSFIVFIGISTLFANSQSNTNVEQITSLNGKWEFYWQELYEPSDFVESTMYKSFISVPGSWRNQTTNNYELPRLGYGTYRTEFRISPDKIGTQQGLSLYYVGSAYRIWIDGKEYSGLGNVGRNKEEEIPYFNRNIVVFTPEDETIEIVMQVSNFSFREGGIISDITFGDANVLSRSMLLNMLLSIFEIGAALIFGAYHFIIYHLRKSDVSLYYIGILSLLYSLRAFLLSETVVHLILPNARWEMLVTIEYIVEAIALLFLGLLLQNIFPKDTNSTIIRLVGIITVLSILFTIFSPTEVFTALMPYTIGTFVLLLIYLIIDVSIKAKIRNREDANLHIIGVLLLICAIVNDLLNYILVIHTFYMISYAFLLMLFIQAAIVSTRYTRINENNLILTKELKALNNSLEEKIEQRTEELREKNKELEQMQMARSKMLANIAHDIGTPLAGVRTYLQILRDNKINVDKHHLYGELIHQISYIQQLNQDLLELSKLESKKLSLNIVNILLRPLLFEIVQNLPQDSCSEFTKVQLGVIQTNIKGNEVHIHADPLRIMQVMYNFISNAIKYNDSEQKEITIHCHVMQINETYEVLIEIEDNGKGVTEAEIPYIFEQFYRKVEGSVQGSGLGLAIIKEIIEQHGGQVGVRNKKEAGGSVFYFTLPASLIR